MNASINVRMFRNCGPDMEILKTGGNEIPPAGHIIPDSTLFILLPPPKENE